jgi:hypothetical protein
VPGIHVVEKRKVDHDLIERERNQTVEKEEQVHEWAGWRDGMEGWDVLELVFRFNFSDSISLFLFLFFSFSFFSGLFVRLAASDSQGHLNMATAAHVLARDSGGPSGPSMRMR